MQSHSVFNVLAHGSNGSDLNIQIMQNRMVRSGVNYTPRSRSLPTGPAKIFSPCVVVIGNLTRRGFLEDDQGGRRLRYVLPSIRICTSASEEPGKDLAPFGAFTPSYWSRTPLKTFKEFPHSPGIEGNRKPQVADNQLNINYETNTSRIVECLIPQSEGASGPKFKSMGCQNPLSQSRK